MTTKPSVFVTRQLPGNALAQLSEHCAVTVNPDDRVLSSAEIIEGVKHCDGLLCLLTDTIDKNILNAAPHLKVISNYAVGFNNIDIQEATRRKIPVCITPGVLTETTADLTFALILTTARRIVEADAFLRAGKFQAWGPSLFLGLDVYGKTLGIIGLGRIGEAVAKRAKGFNMRILYTGHAPKPGSDATFVELKDLLSQSDIITLHTPLTAETRHLIGESEFRLMKKTAILINTTRGPVVDEKALVRALQSGQIAAAGLDVFEEEPVLTPGLTTLSNVTILPHIGSASHETREKMATIAVENLVAIFQHRSPFAMANPEVLKQSL